MVFPSFEFAIFFPLVLALSWALMSRPRVWKPFLLTASYVFYGAIDVASVPYRSQVRVLDMERTFTPGGRYRDTLTLGGRKRIVREPDGIHLNDEGAKVAAGVVLAARGRDFRR